MFILRRLEDSACFRCSQNIEPEELTRKILPNRELELRPMGSPDLNFSRSVVVKILNSLKFDERSALAGSQNLGSTGFIDKILERKDLAFVERVLLICAICPAASRLLLS
jgi:hypothetical protein